MADVLVWCGLFGRDRPFPVTISLDATVYQLEQAIITSLGLSVGPERLMLYLARDSGGNWLRDDKAAAKLLLGGDTSKYDVNLYSTHKLNSDSYFGPDFTLEAGTIQVLVEVRRDPTVLGAAFNSCLGAIRAVAAAAAAASGIAIAFPPTKRQRLANGDVGLEGSWQYSALPWTKLPEPSELTRALTRPLPFRLPNLDVDASELFAVDGPEIQCKVLRIMIESLWLKFQVPPPSGSTDSEDKWHAFYDELLFISERLLLARALPLRQYRNRADKTGTTEEIIRPNLIIHHRGLVLLRGEEKHGGVGIVKPRDELTNKMQEWNPMFYGDLPYTLGYAACGAKLALYAIDRNLHAVEIMDFRSILYQKVDAFKAFYNLAFILERVIALSKRTYPTNLRPYRPNKDGKRTLRLMDDRIERTIKRKQCKDQADFMRLRGIYKTLRAINRKELTRTHLQTVRNLDMSKESRTVVQLSPLGFQREPTNEAEVREWLRGILTALGHWHDRNYCHGNICWEKMIYVPSGDSGYWILFGMDKSQKNEKTVIEWDHNYKGEKLCFRHDLLQLGGLIERLDARLSDTLSEIRKLLTTITHGQSLRADDVLHMVDALCAAESNRE